MPSNLFQRVSTLWILVFTFFFSLAIYNQLQTYGVLNYSLSHSPAEIAWKRQDLGKKTVFTGQLTARDNFIGSLTIHFYKLSDFDGQVIFTLAESGQEKLLATNTYDFYFFSESGHYTLGFPQQPDSQNKTYDLQFQFIPTKGPLPQNYLNISDSVSSKYVFPKSHVVNDKRKLVELIIRRLLLATKSIDYLKTIIISILVTAIVVWVITIPKELKNIDKAYYVSHKLSQVNPFFISLTLLLAMVYGLLTNNIPFAEKVTVWLWLSFAFSLAWYLIILTIDHHLKGLITNIDKTFDRILHYLGRIRSVWPTILLGSAFVLLSAFSKTYILGGDDSRIFYAFPAQYVTNFASKIISDTGVSELVGFLPPRSILAFATLMRILHTYLPTVNLQSALYTANIWGGLILFYCLLKYLLRPQDTYDRLACAVASFTYVFSIFNFYVLFNSKLLSIYLISLFPLSIWLFIKAVREAKLHLIALIAIIWSVFSLTAVAFPWSAAALLVTIPILLFTLQEYWRRFIGYGLTLVVFLGLLNFHWLIYTPYSAIVNKQVNIFNTGLSSQVFREKTKVGVEAVAKINTPLFPLLNLYHQQIQINNSWPYLPIYGSWYTPLLPLGWLFISVVLWAGIKLSAQDAKKKLYIGAACSLLLAIYFFTVNITPWGIDVFAWALEMVPGFVVFRNMFDKFAYPLAFSWGLVLGTSLIILKRRYVLLALLIVSILWAKPFLLGEFDRLPLWTTKNTYNSTSALNSDYLRLVDYIKNKSATGRYLALPLQSGNSASIQDEHLPNHYYNGVSPLLLLTGKNDISGLLSFGNLGQDVHKWLQSGDYEKIGQLLRSLAVEQVIVSNLVSEDLKYSFVYSDQLYSLQTDKFMHELLGEKITDFGTRYSLFDINSKYKSSKIYLTSTESPQIATEDNLKFDKTAPHQYEISVHNLTSPLNLIFLDPYFNGWKVYTATGREVFSKTHFMPLGYANGWKIDPVDVKETFTSQEYSSNSDGSLSIPLRIYFQPYDYFKPSLNLSLFAYIALAIYISLSICKYTLFKR